MNHTSQVLALSLISFTLLIGACSSSSDSVDGTPTTTSAVSFSPETVSADVTSVGVITVAQSYPLDDEAETSIEAEFFNSPEPVSASDLAGAFVGLAGVCVTNGEPASSPESGPIVLEPTNAGDVIVVSSPGGTFANLFLGPDDIYFLESSSLPGGTPTGLTIDSTGGEFSALANIQIPDVDQLTGVSAGEVPVTATSAITWDAGSDPANTLVMIAAFTDDDNPDSVVCFTADTGAFSFPAGTQNALDTDFSASDAAIARLAITLSVNNDELLIVTNGVITDINTGP